MQILISLLAKNNRINVATNSKDISYHRLFIVLPNFLQHSISNIPKS
jgi:hypothetical protein